MHADVGADLAALCRSCGLCCDGSLFGRVDLESGEVDPARRRGLRVLPDGTAFEQPCTALAPAVAGPGDRRCSIYDGRPVSCRRFACRLYERHRREGGPIEDRLTLVRRTRMLLGRAEALGPHAARAMDEYDELMRLLDGFTRA